MRTGISTKTTSTFKYFSRNFTGVDQSIPYRLVGSWEYGHALEEFRRLLDISTEEEIKVYDEFLVSRPEFTYYQGINTAFQAPPDMTKADPKERSRFNDKFQKGGLAWMMALAQIELGSTLSMYGDLKNPFGMIATTSFANEEYLQLLMDDTVAHLKSLSQEGLFREVLDLNRTVDTWTLAYLRRLKVIKDMMMLISDVAEPELVEEMRPFFKELETHEESLVSIVNIWLAGTSSSETNTETRAIKGRGELLGAGPYGAPLTPELIRECNSRIGQTYNSQRVPAPHNRGRAPRSRFKSGDR